MSNRAFRESTVKLLRRVISPWMEMGIVSRDEFDALFSYLSSLAKTGMEPPEVKPKLISGQEAAEMLSISYSQFRQLAKEGAFPFTRRMVGGKTVRYFLPDIVAYMRTGENDEGGDK